MNRNIFWSRIALGAAFFSTALVGCGSESNSGITEPEIGVARAALAGPDCGNGVFQPLLGEQCDDGNNDDDDGCDSNCMIEPHYVCFGNHPSVCTLPDYGDAPPGYGEASHARSIRPSTPFVGRSLWTAFPINNVANNATALGLKIAGDPGTNGNIYFGGASTPFRAFEIPPSGVESVELSVSTYEVTAAGTVMNRGLEVRADAPVRVIATSEKSSTSESWSVWNTDAIGVEYIVLNASTSTASGEQILVVGTDNGTQVFITDAGLGLRASFTLDKGQAYRYQSAEAIVGWTVTGSKPIAVIAGSNCTTIAGSSCDMAVEQLAPVALWSKDYVAGPGFTPGSASRANHVVVARDSNTFVTVTPSTGPVQTQTLAARGSWVFAPATENTQYGYYISADKPIGVVSLITVPAASPLNWDPTLVTWPPVDGYVDEAKMPTSGISVNYTNSLTLVTQTGAHNNIFVGSTQATGWTPIASSGYSFTRVGVGQGDNTITATGGAKFAAIAMGGATAVSYGYSSPYNIGIIGAVTTCYLGNNPPDYELPFTGDVFCNKDDINNPVNDEDAISGTLVIQHGTPSYQLVVPCHDEYFGQPVNARVHGFIDFGIDGNFTDVATKRASAPCIGSTSTTAGTATLQWNNPVWTPGKFGDSVIRLRICEGVHKCDSPIGQADSGEVEDHRVRIGGCGDGIRDIWEGCDDGNTTAGDGCSPTCEVEPGFTCDVGNPDICTITQPPTITSPLTGANVPAPWLPTISGDCVTGMTVTVYEGTAELCTAPCVGGEFTCSGTTAHGPGGYDYIATQSSSTQTSPPSIPVHVNVVVPVDHCWTDAGPVPSGSVFPGSEGCEICLSATGPGSWTRLDEGEDCDDDGIQWTIDKCDGAGKCIHTETSQCYIDFALRANGSEDPNNTCRVCDSDESRTEWTPKPDGTDCPDDGKLWTLNECRGGFCTHDQAGDCWIGGVKFLNGA
ncbi:MAG: GEVED domain-containing protein, partial [Polyangiaceae bacterium]|nr:GEVED domain-containing protein [Polyangiaceae bacterium]